MREKRVEQEFTKQVKNRGGWAVKFIPSVSGLPDRIALLPGGILYFVELKAPGKKPEPHQTVVHNRLRALGFEVFVLDTVESVRDWATLMDLRAQLKDTRG